MINVLTRLNVQFARLFLIVSLVGFAALPASAAVPFQMNFQGHLRDTSGFLLTGSFDLTFRLYATPTGGAPLWSEVQAGVPVTGGLFSVTLGSVTPLPPSALDGTTRFLGIEIAGDTGEMAPRVPIVSVAYAIHANSADTALLAWRADTALDAGRLGGETPGFYLNSDNFTGPKWVTLTSGANADSLHTHAGLVGGGGNPRGAILSGFADVDPTSFPSSGFVVRATRLANDGTSLVGRQVLVYLQATDQSGIHHPAMSDTFVLSTTLSNPPNLQFRANHTLEAPGDHFRIAADPADPTQYLLDASAAASRSEGQFIVVQIFLLN